MTHIRFQEIEPFFTDLDDDDLVPYVLVEEHNEGRHTITMGGGLTRANMREVADILGRALRVAEFQAEVQEGTP